MVTVFMSSLLPAGLDASRNLPCQFGGAEHRSRIPATPKHRIRRGLEMMVFEDTRIITDHEAQRASERTRQQAESTALFYRGKTESFMPAPIRESSFGSTLFTALPLQERGRYIVRCSKLRSSSFNSPRIDCNYQDAQFPWISCLNSFRRLGGVGSRGNSGRKYE